MGKTSSEVKRRYNNKAYDFINLTVKKGEKEKIKAVAENQGKSLNKYINDLIKKDMEE